MPQPRTGSRSIVSLVIAALVLGTFTLSPVAAHFSQNTKHLGRHAWKQFVRKKVFNKRQANRRFVNERQILSATVRNAGRASVELEHGRGVTGVAEDEDQTRVSFNRGIQTCTTTVSSTGSGTTATAQPSGAFPNDVIVAVYWDNLETPSTGSRFHLVVVCP